MMAHGLPVGSGRGLLNADVAHDPDAPKDTFPSSLNAPETLPDLVFSAALEKGRGLSSWLAKAHVLEARAELEQDNKLRTLTVYSDYRVAGDLVGVKWSDAADLVKTKDCASASKDAEKNGTTTSGTPSASSTADEGTASSKSTRVDIAQVKKCFIAAPYKNQTCPGEAALSQASKDYLKVLREAFDKEMFYLLSLLLTEDAHADMLSMFHDDEDGSPFWENDVSSKTAWDWLVNSCVDKTDEERIQRLQSLYRDEGVALA